jgi:hypothetical protein
MRLLILLVILGLTGCANPKQRVQLSNSAPLLSAEEIAAQLHIGMDMEQVESVIKRMYPVIHGASGGLITGAETEFARYDIGEESYINVRFTKLREPNSNVYRVQLTDLKVCRFADLKTPENAEIFPLLRLIHQAPSVDQVEFNPESLIRAVNGLFEAGGEKSVKALREYAKSSREWQDELQYGRDPNRALVVARLLFANNDYDYRPYWWRVEGPTAGGMLEKETWPMLPLALQDDVPFWIAEVPGAGGRALPASYFLEQYADKFVLRAGPLKPTGSPLSAAQALLDSPKWRQAFPEGGRDVYTRGLIRIQALHAASRAFPEIASDFREHALKLYARPGSDQVWNRYLDEARKMHLAWDEKAQSFLSR